MFRLSGNMALGSMPAAYSQEQVSQARSSLQLLKSKQNKPATEESGNRMGSYANNAWQPPVGGKTVLSNNPESLNRAPQVKTPSYQPIERPNVQNVPNLPRRSKAYQEPPVAQQSIQSR